MRRFAWTSAAQGRSSLWELALLFGRLGATAFGGPAAHIALMQDEVVQRRRWLSEEEFLDLLGATNLIPGPNSTEMAIHLGWLRGRWAGLVVAGASFIVPAMLMTGFLGWLYVRFGTVPEAAWLLYGVKPVMIAVVVQAIVMLARKATRGVRQRALTLVAIVLAALGVHELVILFGAGLVSAGWDRSTRRRAPEPPGPMSIAWPAVTNGWPTAVGGGAAIAAPISLHLGSLFWVFLKTGSVLFGSGYVLLAFLRADLVQRLHWMSESQLIDAIAVGQITPGPVFTTATFIGYVLLGPVGAIVATLGIFLPAFVFVALSGPLVPRIRASPDAAAFLDGVNGASLALMTVVTVQLGRAALVDWVTVLIAAVSIYLVTRRRVGSTPLVIFGAVSGWLAYTLRR